jgi:hypothetical protein
LVPSEVLWVAQPATINANAIEANNMSLLLDAFIFSPREEVPLGRDARLWRSAARCYIGES